MPSRIACTLIAVGILPVGLLLGRAVDWLERHEVFPFRRATTQGWWRA